METRDMQSIVIVDGANTYYCEAQPGTPTTSVGWKIRKVNVSGGTTTTSFPIGTRSNIPDNGYNFKQSEYAGLTYSLVPDVTPPTMVSAVKDTVTQITLTLSEFAAVSSITKANAGGFTVFQTGTPATTYAVSAIAPGANNGLVVLTVANMTASAAQGVTVTYANSGNGTVADYAGNLMATNATGVVVAPW